MQTAALKVILPSLGNGLEELSATMQKICGHTDSLGSFRSRYVRGCPSPGHIGHKWIPDVYSRPAEPGWQKPHKVERENMPWKTGIAVSQKKTYRRPR